MNLSGAITFCLENITLNIGLSRFRSHTFPAGIPAPPSAGLQRWSISTSPLTSVSPSLVRAVIASVSVRHPSDAPALTDAYDFGRTLFLPTTELRQQGTKEKFSPYLQLCVEGEVAPNAHSPDSLRLFPVSHVYTHIFKQIFL